MKRPGDEAVDPPRFREGAPGPDTAEGRAASMARALAAPELPGDLALARVRAAVLAEVGTPGARPWWRRPVAVAATVVVLAGGSAWALWARRPAPAAGTAAEAAREEALAAPRSEAERSRPAPPARVATKDEAPARPTGELDRLRSVPPTVLLALRGERPDGEGLSAFNRRGFACSGDQRFTLEGITVGAALGRRDLVDESWRAVETTFQFQAGEGHFLDDAVCTSYWLAHLSHALLVLDESEEGIHYRHRIGELRPRIERAASWLVRPEQQEALDRSARAFPSRLLYHAVAFGLTGVLLDNAALIAVGGEYVDRALALQREDGSFRMEPALDARYQGSVLWKLGWYAQRFPSARVAEALRRGAAWQRARIEPDGTVDMSESTPALDARTRHHRPTLFEVAWGLLYAGTTVGEPEWLGVAERVLVRNRARVWVPDAGVRRP
jgi:hypothetical protein